ncbi:hypothetical protein EC392_03505 [Lonsdalea populi]|uniref:Uncharacterized protein n=1 Tax=Lonsdalea populi TaxID=1172565 RepID=A0A3N0URS6_9GAMM|nr:hypothetical protein EC393_03125 [Lonsdalea populi]ROH83260.1 hypothetical protein EC392_03505 [Lonsdalea populi]
MSGIFWQLLATGSRSIILASLIGVMSGMAMYLVKCDRQTASTKTRLAVESVRADVTIRPPRS